MPEAYTHLRIARAALRAGKLQAGSTAAYEMGANGPDPLFVYRIFSKKKPYPLQELGSRMHVERCGLFLQALIYYARTPAQQSYALGFLTHYAADSVLHPYVAFCMQDGQPFAVREGHGFCEVAMDTLFHQADTGVRRVPANDAAPLLTTADLAEVCMLLRRTLAAVFGVQVPVTELSDTFHMFRFLHRFFYSPRGGKKAAGWVAERVALHRPGYALSHMTPAKQPDAGFPKQWKHPFTGREMNAGPHALALCAMQLAAGYQAAAQQFWNGALTLPQLAQTLGNNSYETGCPLPPTAQKNQDAPSETCTPAPAQAAPQAAAEPAQAEPAQAEPAQAEPTQAEPTQAELAQAEPTQAEPAQGESTQAESTQAEHTQAEHTQAEPAQGEPTQPQTERVPVADTASSSAQAEAETAMPDAETLAREILAQKAATLS